MEYQEQRFNDGVELAYLLDEALGIQASLQSGEHVDILDLDDFCGRVDDVVEPRKLPRTPSLPYSRERLTYIPRPYEDILNTSENLFFAQAYGSFLGRGSREHSENLVIKLTEAIDGLIGRDVYIQGMNAHEFMQPAT